MDREESTTGFLVAHTQIEFIFYMTKNQNKGNLIPPMSYVSKCHYLGF